MLVLSRKLNQEITIGDNITVTILKIKGNTVRLGIDAPRHIRVIRGELPAKTENETANVTIVFSDPIEVGGTNIEVVPFTSDTTSIQSPATENEPKADSRLPREYQSISYKSRVPESLSHNRLKAIVAELSPIKSQQSTQDV